MDLIEVGWGKEDWIGLAQNRNRWRALVNFAVEPSGSMKCWESVACSHNWWPLEQYLAP
jgi:hypothetical protein